MNRSIYFNLCEEKLSVLCTRVELRGKLNILAFHLHAEDFYLHFFNLLYGYSLVNINQATHNVAGVDLVDLVGKLVLQVSSTATKQKVESALSKDLSAYGGFSFKFISISKDASALRVMSFKNPHALVFDPPMDVSDVKTLLNKISHMDIVRQQEIYGFLKRELSPAMDAEPLAETNLAAVINILAKEDLSADMAANVAIPFDPEKKILDNGLAAAAMVIEDYKIYYGRIQKIYSEFDVAGQNRSKSVLDSLRNSYIKLSSKFSADELFFEIVDLAIKTVQKSANYVQIPLEELELCVNVLAVDAFVRCRIFENPVGA